MWLTLAAIGVLAVTPSAPPDSDQYPSEEALRRYTQGRVLEEAGFRSDALNEYFRAFAIDANAAIATRASEVAAARGDHDRSLEFANKALALEPARLAPRVASWSERGLLETRDGRLRLTEDGFLLSDALFVDLL